MPGNTHTETSRMISDHIFAHCGPAKLAPEINHHRWLPTILSHSKLAIGKIKHLLSPESDNLKERLWLVILLSRTILEPRNAHYCDWQSQQNLMEWQGELQAFVTVRSYYPLSTRSSGYTEPTCSGLVLCKFPSCAEVTFWGKVYAAKVVG